LSRMSFVPVTVVSLLFIAQIIMGMYLLSDVLQIEVVASIGVVLYVLSGILFGMLPIFEFRKQGAS
jgi:hypothetical protein